MLRIVVFLVVSLLPGDSWAEYRGVSAFAAMNPRFPCDALLATTDFAKKPAISVLYETFGLDHTCLHRFMQRYHDKPHIVQIHFSNEVCRRNKNCLATDTLHPELSVKNHNRLLERMSIETQIEISLRLFFLRSSLEGAINGNTRVILGAGLEDNYSSRAFENLVRQFIANGWPYEISRNRHAGGKSFRNVQFQEFHSAKGKPGRLACIANEDGNYGQTAKKSQKFLSRYRKCTAVFLWREAHQGRAKGQPRLPARERDFIYTAADVVELGGLLQ